MKTEQLNNLSNEYNENGCYYLVESDGDVMMRYHGVFDGITLVYEDIHAENCTYRKIKNDNTFEIRHCREGRFEGNTTSGFFYMGPGDLSIYKSQNEIDEYNFPLHHYHGITIIIDIEKAPQCFSCFLKDVNVKPENLMNKFCKTTEAFVARSMPSIAHIFDELYSIPKCILEGYLKVKVLELMLFLSSIDTKTDEIVERSFSHNQKILAQNISSYLLDHIDCKITLEQLTDIFHVSGTQIKSSIKAVYGISLHNMIRIQKMQSAARLLQETDLTILEIAGRHGYDNASKFASVFKSYMGLTPKEYRNKPTKIENVYT